MKTDREDDLSEETILIRSFLEARVVAHRKRSSLNRDSNGKMTIAAGREAQNGKSIGKMYSITAIVYL